MDSPAESMIEFETDPTERAPTEDEDTIVFDHVLDNILKLAPNHPLRQIIPANFPYHNISAFLVFSDADYKQMTYPDVSLRPGGAARMKPILPGAANIFCQFREFIKHRFTLNDNSFPPNEAWLELQNTDWIDFLANYTTLSSPPAPSTPPYGPLTTSGKLLNATSLHSLGSQMRRIGITSNGLC